jgi:hypothetical protein
LFVAEIHETQSCSDKKKSFFLICISQQIKMSSSQYLPGSFAQQVQGTPVAQSSLRVKVWNRTTNSVMTHPWIWGGLLTLLIIALSVLFVVWAVVATNENNDHDHWKKNSQTVWLTPYGTITDLSQSYASSFMTIASAHCMPQAYVDADLTDISHIVLLGDKFVGGTGSVQQKDLWYMLMRNAVSPHAVVVDRTAADQSADGIQSRMQDLEIEFPSGFPGRVMLAISVGAIDLVRSLGNGGPTLDQLLESIVEALEDISTSTDLFPHGVYVYLLDYADSSNGLGYIHPTLGQACDAPLGAVLNVAQPTPSKWVGGLNHISAMMAASAYKHGFAYVPTSLLLSRLGYNRSKVRFSPPSFEDSMAVRRDDIFNNDCWTLNSEGHHKLAEIMSAFLKHQPILYYV